MRCDSPVVDVSAISGKNIGNAIQLLGLGAALLGRRLQVDRGPFGLDHCHRPAVTIAQDIIGKGAARKLLFAADALPVSHIPADIG